MEIILAKKISHTDGANNIYVCVCVFACVCVCVCVCVISNMGNCDSRTGCRTMVSLGSRRVCLTTDVLQTYQD